MAYTHEDYVSAYEEAREYLKDALSSIQGMKDFICVQEMIEETIDMLESDVEEHIEAYEEECRQELAYQNSEYMRSVV